MSLIPEYTHPHVQDHRDRDQRETQPIIIHLLRLGVDTLHTPRRQQWFPPRRGFV